MERLAVDQGREGTSMAMGSREGRTLHAMSIDDAYEVHRVLASGHGCRTEVVTIDGLGPYLRKRLPVSRADRRVWAALAECDNPRLPHMVAAYETPDEFVVICDFIPGDSLAEVMGARKCLEASEAVRVVLELCEAVEELHRRGVVHCDIAPQNVLLAADGAHLIDLDIARMVGTAPSSEAPALGTHGFAAPEQYGFAPVDERTDIYALARLLGYLLTGVEPRDWHQSTLDDDGVVPAAMRTVIERGGSFEPSSRFQSVGDLAHAVREAAGQLNAASATPIANTANCGEDAASDGANERRRRDAAPSPSKARSIRRAASMLGIGAVASFVGFCLAVALLFPDYFEADVPPEKDKIAAQDGELAAGGRMASTEEDARGVSDAAKGSVPMSSSDAETVIFQEDLTVVESAWSWNDGFVSYTFALCNKSVDATIEFPTVKIVGRDGEGSLISSDDQVLPAISPGETFYFSSIVDTGGERPEEVEFLPVVPDEFQVQKTRSDGAVLRVSSVVPATDALGGEVFVGEVVWESGERVQGYSSEVIVAVVLRDAEGELVGGTNAFTSCPERGVPVSFETFGERLPPYASIEAYAYEW